VYHILNKIYLNGESHTVELLKEVVINSQLIYNRLPRLVEMGIINKKVHQDRSRSVTYCLTEKGREIYGHLNAIKELIGEGRIL